MSTAEYAALEGSYAGLRLVKTRRVVVIEIEMPIEALRKIIDVLGTPDPASEVPVAVALLSGDVVRASSSTAEESRPSTSKPVGEAARPRTPWHELSRTKQAAIRCGEEKFSSFLEAQWPARMAVCGSDAAEFVRDYCNVKSRRDLDTSNHSSRRWDALDAEYRAWAGLATEPRG